MSRILSQFFDDRVAQIGCQELTKAYVVCTLSNVQPVDLSKHSIVLTYDRASRFEHYQSIGDWVLWLGVFCPEKLHEHKTVYESFGRLSYSRCYDIVRRQIKVYEELADSLPVIITNVRKNLDDCVIR